MAVQAHSRRPDARVNQSPPRLPEFGAPQRCGGEVYQRAVTRTARDETGRWTTIAVAPERWVPCSRFASPLVPEVSFCASHMPHDWVAVAALRYELWSGLAEDLWRDVIREYPPPGRR